MSALKKPIFALVGVVAMLLTGLFFATSSASAYPPGTAPTLGVSDTSPTCGETVTVSGAHYQPGETVTVTQGGKSYTVTARLERDVHARHHHRLPERHRRGRDHGHRQQLGRCRGHQPDRGR